MNTMATRWLCQRTQSICLAESRSNAQLDVTPLIENHDPVGKCVGDFLITFLQLFHQMGPDPVPSKQSDWCTGRQHSKKHSQTQSLLNEIRDLCASSMSLRSASRDLLPLDPTNTSIGISEREIKTRCHSAWQRCLTTQWRSFQCMSKWRFNDKVPTNKIKKNR